MRENGHGFRFYRLYPGNHRAVWFLSAQFGYDFGVEQVHASFHFLYIAPTCLTARGQNKITSSSIGQQEFFQRRSRRSLHPAPNLYRYQHSSFGAALGHHLGAFGNAGVQELTESRFRILNGPSLNVVSP